MPFTNSPEFSTYRTVPLKFDGTALYRSGNLQTQRDCNITNMFYERVSQENQTREVFLTKRPGLTTSAYSLTKSDSDDQLRGYYYDIASNRFYWAVNNKIYSVSPDVGTTVRTVATLNTSVGYVGFCEFLQVSTSKRLVLISDGTDLWVDDYAATTCTAVVDADLPTPHVPQPVSMNGYAFLAALNTGDLYNSANDDPTDWDSAEFISAEMSGDYIIKIAQNRNYVATFGTNSLEIFWDAANATGSPMKRNDSGYRNVGYITGMKQIGNILYFIGQDTNRNVGVYMLDGFNLQKISNSVVDRTIQTLNITDNSKAPVETDRDGYAISVDGHSFYAVVVQQTTWVYDIDEKFWYEWRDAVSDSALAIEASWGMYNGGQYVAIAGQTYVSRMSPSVYQDFGLGFLAQYTTERFDAGSYNFKTLLKATLHADQYLATGTSLLTLEWSDDDWGSYTGTRYFNVFKMSPKLYTLGQFRTRSFRFSYTDNYPLRIKSLELEINIGTH